jgi:hypothetical protein
VSRLAETIWLVLVHEQRSSVVFWNIRYTPSAGVTSVSVSVATGAGVSVTAGAGVSASNTESDQLRSAVNAESPVLLSIER